MIFQKIWWLSAVSSPKQKWATSSAYNFQENYLIFSDKYFTILRKIFWYFKETSALCSTGQSRNEPLILNFYPLQGLISDKWKHTFNYEFCMYSLVLSNIFEFYFHPFCHFCAQWILKTKERRSLNFLGHSMLELIARKFPIWFFCPNCQ